LKLGATPTSLSWRLTAREAAAGWRCSGPALVVGGEADWNAPNSLPSGFVPEGFPTNLLHEPRRTLLEAMTSGVRPAGPQGDLDHGPAVVDTAANRCLESR